MILLWILIALVLGWVVAVVISITRFSMPLVPALTPGDVSGARDPGFFDLQAQAFRENGYRHVGDFAWHDGLSTTIMRIFQEATRESYGWAVEESVAGLDGAKQSVSVLTEFTDGSLLDTTSAGPTKLAMPPWFLREAVAPDTELLLKRHRERLHALVGQGMEIRIPDEGELLDMVRRNERRLGEYQVQQGLMRLDRGRLRFSARSVARVVLVGFGHFLSGPFRRKAD
ncbi:MAG: hypothetical protein ACM3ZC_13655 [Bacteroidota bacterium]